MVSGKPSTRMARQMEHVSTTRLLFYVYTHRRVGVRSAWQTGIWVLYSRYRRMSCTIGVRTVLQLLVVALIHNPEYEGNGCFGTIF
jgi:hypothetical protein